MERIRTWGKKIVVVVNKDDLLETAEQREEVRSFVADNARRLLGFEPEIFFVSARSGIREKQGQPVKVASGFGLLERYVTSALNEGGRARLKLLNPLGVGAAVAETQLAGIRDRQSLLQDDVSTLKQVESQLELYQRDLQRDFELRIINVNQVLFDLEQRGYRL